MKNRAKSEKIQKVRKKRKIKKNGEKLEIIRKKCETEKNRKNENYKKTRSIPNHGKHRNQKIKNQNRKYEKLIISVYLA